MPMNQIIQARRRALGLTQEQVAERLGVTAPAVNKWEKGTNFPDVTLLPALARLLETDLNELFCFRENPGPEEIARFSQELAELTRREGAEAGFARAQRELRVFPNCSALRCQCAVLLEGLLLLEGRSPDAPPFGDALRAWYEACADCADEEVRSRAQYMLAGHRLRAGDASGAQEMLDRLPERVHADGRLMQAELYIRRGETEAARALLERAVLEGVNEVQGFLWKLADAELACDDADAAEEIAGISRDAAALFGLWDYSARIGPLQVALARRDAPQCVRLLRRLLEASQEGWNPAQSVLYRHIAGGRGRPALARMLEPLLNDMETNPDYAFLRGEAAFVELIREFRARPAEQESGAPPEDARP